MTSINQSKITIFEADYSDSTMTIEQQQFLELLRAGLWGRPADASLFQGDVDWKAIFRTAKEQTVQIIVADGMETLPRSLTPKKQTIYKVAIKRTTNSLTHKFLNSTINRITNALDAAGIPSVLLKGQGVAQNYLNPESRMCGDIDIYVGMENFERACQVLKNEGATGTEDYDNHEFHIALDLEGATIEVHKKADVLSKKKFNESLQQWTKDKLDSKIADSSLPQWDNEGVSINLPDPTYNAFYIIHHAVRHMIGEGIGFRHVCDWVVFLHTHQAQIDKEELLSKLKEYNMLQVWQLFGAVATDTLGLPKEELPFASDIPLTSRTEALLNHIFSTGNFGQFSAKKRDTQSCYIKRKWHNFWFQTSRLFKLHKIFPAYTRTFAWGWLTNALYRFFTRQ